MKEDNAVGGIKAGKGALDAGCCVRVPDGGGNATHVMALSNIDEPEIDVRHGQRAEAGLTGDIGDIVAAVGECRHTGFGHDRSAARLRRDIIEDGDAHCEQSVDVRRRTGG